MEKRKAHYPLTTVKRVATECRVSFSTAPQFVETRRRLYLRSTFTLQIALSILLAGGTAVVGAVYAHGTSLPALQDNLLPLVAAIVAFQLQDWLRCYYFVEENSRAVFVNDVVSNGGPVVSLIVLFAAGLLDVATSLWVIAGSSALAFGLGWSRERITPAWRESGQTLLQGWRMGRDYLLAVQFQWVGSQGVLLVGASFLGVQTAGGIRAAQNIVGPINILLQVMENVVPVRAARRFTAEGRSELVEYLKEITVIGSAALFLVFLVLGFCSTIRMDIAYGQQYLAYASLVVWQVGYFAVTFYLRQIIYFHRSINQTRVIAVSSVVLALVAIGLSLMVVPEFAETGVMFSLVAGQLTGLVFLIAAARRRS